jgi:predicted RNase H-like nuclease (RuvC/YqgF family)
MSIFSPELLFTILAATGGGAIGAVIQAIFARRKNKAEALHLEAQTDSVVVNAALQVADRLQVQLAELERRTNLLAGKNKEVREELALVHTQNLKMSKQIAKLERENKSLKTSYTKLKEENEKLKTKLDSYNKSDG